MSFDTGMVSDERSERGCSRAPHETPVSSFGARVNPSSWSRIRRILAPILRGGVLSGRRYGTPRRIY
jgi:hypothetical protein